MGSAPPPSPPGPHARGGRAALIDALTALVEQVGPEGFSIAQAARAAGLSSAAPYKHFADRPAALTAVAQDGMARLGAAMAQAARAQQPPRDKVAAVGLAYLTFAKRNPGVFRLMFSHKSPGGPDQVLRAIGAQAFGVIVACVAEALRVPPQSAPVQDTALLLWSNVHGLAALAAEGRMSVYGQTVDDAALVSRMCEAYLPLA